MSTANTKSPTPPSAQVTNTRYGVVAIGLHWLIAIAIISSFSLGFYMSDLPLSPQKLKFYSWHKWAGVTIFLCVLVRLVWRLSHRPDVYKRQVFGENNVRFSGNFFRVEPETKT